MGAGQWTRTNGCASLVFLIFNTLLRLQNTVFADFAQPTTIATLVNQSVSRDGQSDTDSLLSRDLHLHRAQPAQAATLFIDYLYRSIKFMRQWNALDRVPNGRKLKSEHLRQLFRSLHLDHFEHIEQLKEWEEEEEGDPHFLTIARKRVWNVHTLHTPSGITGRSVPFRALLALFQNSPHLPAARNQTRPSTTYRTPSASQS